MNHLHMIGLHSLYYNHFLNYNCKYFYLWILLDFNRSHFLIKLRFFHIYKSLMMQNYYLNFY